VTEISEGYRNNQVSASTTRMLLNETRNYIKGCKHSMKAMLWESSRGNKITCNLPVQESSEDSNSWLEWKVTFELCHFTSLLPSHWHHKYHWTQKISLAITVPNSFLRYVVQAGLKFLGPSGLHTSAFWVFDNMGGGPLCPASFKNFWPVKSMILNLHVLSHRVIITQE
jgi:hypothetical protein